MTTKELAARPQIQTATTTATKTDTWKTKPVIMRTNHFTTTNYWRFTWKRQDYWMVRITSVPTGLSYFKWVIIDGWGRCASRTMCSGPERRRYRPKRPILSRG